ncbi:hypothetical protein CEUSTIGMA_g3199.t1 [Chlamydomonas eustigma]|uniref:3'-5' exonuclease domain-containing protein n=1 Tax=Chlamydomonas eustigma TaxID=1157962 RepID=A0A250WY96_9CHLO|nr:hypothetical protein CEUSTIGMA_g3199.t1 [Chlamydomonas eustigma]|eukprot:GAX75756.1 hypothetical protein CEUSTIGMA_g3199.t1 [Chlamydomonas eustigma]
MELLKVRQFAIDTEHHSWRSYLGMTCLIQISTGHVDWIIDTIKLHDHMHLLRDVFSNSSIVKVLHGSANDILWLQRDFYLYLVNVFDTEKACQILGKEQRSLSHLLLHYCGVQADKALQKSDWRTRPLSVEQMRYARTDVHYLLYIAARLRQELDDTSRKAGPLPTCHQSAPAWTSSAPVERSDSEVQPQPILLSSSHIRAISISNKLSLNLYCKPDAPTAINTAVSNILKCHTSGIPAVSVTAASDKKGANGAIEPGLGQTHTGAGLEWRVRALCQWRDRVSRQDDDNPQFVLPDPLVLALSLLCPDNPKDVKQILNKHLKATSPPLEISRAPWEQAPTLCQLLKKELPASSLRNDSELAAESDALSSASMKNVATKAAKRTDIEKKEWLIQKFSAKSQVYQNAQMLSKEGDLLCYCDTRKIEWYLSKGIAERISHDPPIIRLLFEHKGADQQAGNTFYSQCKSNRCVVCGDESHYLRYRIVPPCYRRNFPLHLKSHRSHDVVLLCVECHQLAHKASELAKQSIAADFGIPLNPIREGHSSTLQFSLLDHPACTKINGKDCKGYSAMSTSSREVISPLRDSNSNHQAKSVGPNPDITPAQDKEVDLPLFYRPGAARRAAVALQKTSDHPFPVQRVRELENVIKMYMGRGPSTEPFGLMNGDLEAALMEGLGHRKRRQLAMTLMQSDDVAAANISEVSAPEEGVPQFGNVGNVENVGASALEDNLKECAAEQLTPSASSLPTQEPADSIMKTIVQNALHIGESKVPIAGHEWHGKMVVAAALKMDEDRALQKLSSRFRSAFVEVCKPRFLPPNWDVQHHLSRELGEFSIFQAVSHDMNDQVKVD